MREIRFIFVFLILSLNGCGEVILHDLDELKANRVSVLLSDNGITSEKVRAGKFWSVRVSNGHVSKALKALEENRIFARSLEREIESSQSLLQTKEEREHLFERKRARSIEQTLETLSHVLEARVHLNLAQEDETSLAHTPKIVSGSVLLVVEQDAEFDTESPRKLLAGAVGIEGEKILIAVERVNQQRGSQSEGRELVALRESVMRFPWPEMTWIYYAGALLVLSVVFLRLKRNKKSQSSAEVEKDYTEKLSPRVSKVVDTSLLQGEALA